MQKMKNFKVLFHYLEQDKFRLILYILLVLSTYLPALLAAYFWGKAIELLIMKNTIGFISYLAIWEGIFIFCYSILQIPRDKLYNYFEIKFMREVSFDLYKKIDNLPAKAFEDIGVGEFINRLYNDTDRVMSLLNSLIRLLCKGLVVIVVIGLSFYISWKLGLEVLVFCITMGVISYVFFPKIKSSQEKIKNKTDNYVKVATENITGIREIKALGIKKNVEKNVFSSLKDIFKEEKKIRNYEVLYYALNNLTFFILQFILIYTAGKFFCANHKYNRKHSKKKLIGKLNNCLHLTYQLHRYNEQHPDWLQITKKNS